MCSQEAIYSLTQGQAVVRRLPPAIATNLVDGEVVKNYSKIIENNLLGYLSEIVGEENIYTSMTDKITHSYDATQEQYLPDVVVYVSSTQEVSRVVKLANEFKVPVIPRGAGSGFTGGTLAVQGGIVLVLTGMDKILEIDTDNLTAIVEPGVVTSVFQNAVEEVGLFYPPDPASKEYCTLGGNVAECAGGPRCVKYGVTKDYILGLEVVTPTGDIIRTGGPTLKNVVGYDLTKLFVGSEGTLGIITEITLKLLPKPEAKKTMLVQFESIDAAAHAVSAIIGAKIIPTTLEFMDASSINCIREQISPSIPHECQAILILEVDGDMESLGEMAEKVLTAIKEFGILDTRIAENDQESEEIWQVRRTLAPNLKQIKPDIFNEDIVVPRSKIPDMIRRLEAISKEYDVPIVNFGHAGDGNIHVHVMVDVLEPGTKEKVEQILEKVFQSAIELRGSITGEHGIGISKKKYLGMELNGPTIEYMKCIKSALDPNGVLNPGKIFLDE